MRTDWKHLALVALLAAPVAGYAADAANPAPADAKKESAEPKKDSDVLSQGEYARMLAFRLGLFPSLTVSPSEQEAAAALAAQGIVPFDGWDLDKVLSPPVFARTLIQALGKADQIPSGKEWDPAAWMDLANKLGLVLTHATDGVDAASPLVRQFNATTEPPSSSSNPLIRREIFAQPDEKYIGTDAGFEHSFIPVSVVVPQLDQVRPPAPRPHRPTATPPRPVPPSPPPVTTPGLPSGALPPMFPANPAN